MSTSIETRVTVLEKRLERSRRHARWAMAALALVSVALLCGLARSGSGGPSEVRGSSFILEDEQGRTRARLAMVDDGPGLVFLDENGRFRAGLGVSKRDGGMITLRDEAGKLRFTLTAPADATKLMMWEGDQVRVSLRSRKEGAGLSLGDEQGKPRVVLNALGRDVVLMLDDENGKTRLGMGVVKTGPSITAQDETGKVVWRAP